MAALHGRRRADVCLLSMPYPPLNQPSMALGLLAAALRRADISVTALYPCLWFAERIGLDAYTFIGDSKQEFLIGEWTFGSAAFPEHRPRDDAYLDAVLAAPVTEGLLRKSRFGGNPRDALARVRESAPRFVDDVAHRVLDGNPKIVGCTSTFMQHVPSLAVLRRIRELAPDVATVIGGANCEGEMGVATRRCFPWIDFAVSGEAELLFPELCRHILANGRGAPLPKPLHGVIGGDDPALAGAAPAPRAAVEDMNRSPQPDFDDYFDALNASALGRFIVPGLAIETSRGCWWGAKHHCTFCGLNGGNMAFRSKQPDRVVRELDALSGRYGVERFNVVDNILDLGYIQTLLPQLATGKPYNLFFETKANLRRDQLERIAAAGIRRLQPGIENLHDEILRLIDKGTTAVINIRLLKWARELGVFITWNFLWDIPGETDAWYGEIADWLPRVVHLQPPGIDRIQFHRFSPYHMRPAGFGLSLEPFPSYAAVYPAADRDLRDLAYYFQDSKRRPARDVIAERPNLKRVIRLIARWNRAWQADHLDRPVLLVRAEDEDGLEIRDTRGFVLERGYRVGGLEARLLRACEDGQSADSLAGIMARECGAGPDEVAAGIDALDRRGLVLRIGKRIMSLLLHEVRPIPDTQEEFPGGYVDIGAWHDARVREASPELDRALA